MLLAVRQAVRQHNWRALTRSTVGFIWIAAMLIAKLYFHDDALAPQ